MIIQLKNAPEKEVIVETIAIAYLVCQEAGTIHGYVWLLSVKHLDILFTSIMNSLMKEGFL